MTYAVVLQFTESFYHYIEKRMRLYRGAIFKLFEINDNKNI